MNIHHLHDIIWTYFILLIKSSCLWVGRIVVFFWHFYVSSCPLRIFSYQRMKIKIQICILFNKFSSIIIKQQQHLVFFFIRISKSTMRKKHSERDHDVHRTKFLVRFSMSFEESNPGSFRLIISRNTNILLFFNYTLNT